MLLQERFKAGLVAHVKLLHGRTHMKTLRRTCAATILTLALALAVLAGEIDCPGAVSPPPPPTGTTSTDTITTSVILAIVNVIN